MSKTVIILDFYEIRNAIKDYIKIWHQKKLFPDSIIDDNNMKFQIKNKEKSIGHELIEVPYLDSVEVVCQ